MRRPAIFRHRPTGFVCASAAALLAAGQLPAQIITDGSMGPAVTLDGAHEQIGANLGQLRGANLFHSFASFNIPAAGSATFDGTPDIANVIARVTGGSASNIDGKLACSIPGANFFLMNPHGVVFGPDATVEISGALIVTTADALKLSDGGKFAAATDPALSVLTTAPPAAFGFLGSSPASITVRGQVVAEPQTEVALVGGDINIIGGTVGSAGGRVRIVSAASPGEAVILAPDAQADLSSFARLGRVVASDGGLVNVNGDGGGRILIQAHDLQMDNADLQAQTLGGTDARGIDVELRGTLSLTSGAQFSTTTIAPGRGGDIDVSAANIDMRQGNSTAFTGLAAGSQQAGGPGGDIRVTSRSLTISDGARITTTTSSGGAGGNIIVDADQIVLDRGGNAFDLTGIVARTLQGAAGGSVLIDAQSLTILNGAVVDASTGGAGAGGFVNIDVDRILLDRGSFDLRASDGDPIGVGIFAQALGTQSDAGDGGTILISAASVDLRGGSQISATTGGPGDGGNVLITALDRIALDRAGSVFFNGITAVSRNDPVNGGAAGFIEINTPLLELRGASGISAATVGPNAGGDIVVNAGDIRLIDQSIIQSRSVGAGDAGNISLVARRTINVLGDSVISAEALLDGGNISLSAGDFIRFVESRLTAQAGRDGAAICIGCPIPSPDAGPSRVLVLDRSEINALANGTPVLIQIGSDFYLNNDSRILTNTPRDFPETDISGSLLTLPETLPGEGARLRESCGQRLGDNVSSFIATGRGGLPIEPDGFRPSALFPDHPETAAGGD